MNSQSAAPDCLECVEEDTAPWEGGDVTREEARPATECAICGKPSTWLAFIILRDLPAVRYRHMVAKPKDIRIPTPLHGACDECQHHADGVSAADMLRKGWPRVVKAMSAAGLPAPPIDKASVQWERLIASGECPALADSPALKGG